MERLLARDIMPDAVFCVNDPTAIGAYKVLRKRGIKVPDRVAIAGFSPVLESDIMEVPLTSAIQNARAMGEQAAQLLMSRILNVHHSPEPMRQTIQVHLSVKLSSLKRNRGARSRR